MIAVHWYGPYASIEAARADANELWGSGLYFAIGKTKYQRQPGCQYVGIASHLANRLKVRHHKLSRITSGMGLWLGEVVTAEPSGKRMKVTPATLDYAEWLHARFMKLPLNDKKSKTLPPRSVTVLNRWFSLKETARKRRPHPDWPDLIDFPGCDSDVPARAVWFGRRRHRLFLAPDYAKPD